MKDSFLQEVKDLEDAKNPKTSSEKLLALASRNEMIFTIAIAKNPSAPPSLLEKFAQQTTHIASKELQKDLQLALVANPNTPRKWLMQLGAFFPEALLQNPMFSLLLLEDPDALNQIPQNTLESILSVYDVPRFILTYASKNPSESVRTKVAQHPCISEHMLQTFSFDNSTLVRTMVAGNPKTSEKLLGRLAADHKIQVREAVAKNPKTPKKILRQFAEDISSRIRIAVHDNPSLPSDRLQLLYRAGSTQTLETYQEPDPAFDPKTIEAIETRGFWLKFLLAKHSKTPLDMLLTLSNDTEGDTRKEVAKNQAFPIEYIQEFSESKDKKLREGVAKNPKAPESVLKKLARDKEANVRVSVANREQLPDELLQRFLNDPFVPVRVALASRTPLPQAFLETLATDPHQGVRKQILHHPQITPNLLWRLVTDGNRSVRVLAKTHFKVSQLQGISLLQKLGVYQNLRMPYKHEKQLSTKKLSTKDLALLAKGGSFAKLLLLKHPLVSTDYLIQFSSDSDSKVQEEVAAHRKTPAFIVEKLSSSPFYHVRRNAAGNLILPESACVRLAKDPQIYVRLALLARKDLSSEIVSSLAQDAYGMTRKQAAEHPNMPKACLQELQDAGASADLKQFKTPRKTLPPKVLTRLSKQGPFARLLAAKHPNTPPEVLLTLSRQEKVLAEEVAKNPNVPPKALVQFAQSLSSTLRKQAAQNPNLPRECLDLLQRAGSAKNLQQREKPLKILTENEKQTLLIGGPWTRILIALHPSASDKDFATLSQDTCMEVRRAVASNHSCTEIVQSLLASDKESKVRKTLANNKNISLETLKKLCDDNSYRVINQAVKNAKILPEYLETLLTSENKHIPLVLASLEKSTPRILATLAKHADPKVRIAVTQNPKTPLVTLQFLEDDLDRDVKRKAHFARIHLQRRLR